MPHTSEQNNTIPIQFVDSLALVEQFNELQTAKAACIASIYKNEYSSYFANAVIRLIKITACNEKALTARGTVTS